MFKLGTKPGGMGVGIISAGRVGAALGNALRANGHQITGAVAISQTSKHRAEDLLPGVPILDIASVVERSELVILAVPDDELAPLAAGLDIAGIVPGGQIFMHTCGKYGIEVLAPLEKAGAITLAMHPAMTFTGTSLDLKRLIGCPWAITAKPMFQPIAEALVLELDGRSFLIPEADRPAYHLAMAHGANHLVALVNQSLQILDQIGVSEPARLLEPLLSSALEETLRVGAAALTGPVSRGDVGTVGSHLAAIRELRIPNLSETYRQLAKAAALISKLDEAKVAKLIELLEAEKFEE